MQIRKMIACFICPVLLFCSSCGSLGENDSSTAAADESVTEEIFAMDTYMTVTAYGENGQEAVDEAIAYIEKLDAMLSIGSTDSEISQLNETGSAILSTEATEILARALEVSEMTQGAFNPAMYPLMEAWGFPTQSYRVPSQTELDALLLLTDLSGLSFDAESGTVCLQIDGMKLDLGGIAKGYTSAGIMEIFKNCGVTSGLVSLGGNVQVCGTKTDGSAWRVALQNPDGSEDYLGVLEVQDKAVITSGGYERYFEEDGVTYHHIIDPETGYPAESGLTSVTIISDDGALADGLSTALFVMGLDDGVAFWRENSDLFDVIFLTEDGVLYVTEGVADVFSSDSDWNVIEEVE